MNTLLKPWGQLPREFRTEAVRPYYEALCRKKAQLIIKRMFDLILSCVLIVLLSPVMLILAVAIKLDSPGTVMFRQVRVTQYGKEFRIFKFRTMVQNAQQLGTQVTVKGDSRITRMGHLLRKCRLDELPQLFNILKGEMTFVGPRPPLVSEVEKYNSYQRQRLGVKQGLTCFWQCSGRNNIGFEEWVALDLKYIKTRGIWTDIKILLKTVSAVLRMDGAC